VANLRAEIKKTKVVLAPL